MEGGGEWGVGAGGRGCVQPLRNGIPSWVGLVPSEGRFGVARATGSRRSATVVIASVETVGLRSRPRRCCLSMLSVSC